MKVKINSKDEEFPEKTTIMDYLKQNNRHISGVCKMKELDPYGSCRLCLVDINNRMLPACSTYPRENDSIDTTSESVISMRRTALELMLSDHEGDCMGPCNNGCPSFSEVQSYVALIAMGKYTEAVELMKKDYILPASLGRVCPAFCEKECRRQFVEGNILIREAKRFAADYDLEHGPWMPEIPPETGKSIGIIGGGPAGLSCAFYLRQKGHAITIYEAMPKLGGMLRYGIPKFRLPKDILDKDIATVIDTGVEVKTNTAIGRDITLAELQKKHDAVFIGTGAWTSMDAGLEGSDKVGVMDAIEFLRKISLGEKVDIGPDVLVVGGGNSAMDVARTAKRLGCNVMLSYRRSMNEMPANPVEIHEAEEEGVEFLTLTNPVGLKGQTKLEEVELVKMELGEPDASGRRRPIVCAGSNYCIAADTIVFAIGQRPDFKLLEQFGIGATKWSAAYDDVTYETNIPGVFVGGDLALGAATVIEAIATAKNAAYMIDWYLKGELPKIKQFLTEPWHHLDEIYSDEKYKNFLLGYKPYKHWKKPTEEMYKDIERKPQGKPMIYPAEKRIKSFDEISETLPEKAILKEVSRCMSCGCLDGFECKLREYATMYGAEQSKFAGEKQVDKIDESHPHIILDNNKCILCGRCVNLTHEITGEGLIDNLNRGFPTKNGPPIGMQLGEVKGDFAGQFVDDCPTGAFAHKTPYPKDGPWDSTPVTTVCYQCGIGCEMNINIFKGVPINISSDDNSWNHGLVCDRPRFIREWEEAVLKPMVKKGNTFEEIPKDKAKELLKKHLDDLAIVLTPNVTNDEAKALIKFAKKHEFKIGAIFDEGKSTAKLADIFKSKRIKLEVELSDYPLLKPFIHIAKKYGAIITNDKPDIAIVNAPAKPENIPTIIMHKGLNELGLIELGLEPIPKAKNYLVIGSTDKKFKGFVISLGKNNYADLILPLPAWINRSGKVINLEGRELEVKQVLEGPSLMDILKTYF
ncbi:MAG: 2Fe-2S iron-sulfur cluster binding domain-containing protein [Asgard group archaeon]|nr:2Fe-2S iron-sulfur cluster binding domain-containing protein [Asgard group archaeon]